MKLKSILKFYAVSPIHAGAGDSTATVDLPIERERHTNWPVIYASGIKGAMREHFRNFLSETDELPEKIRNYKYKNNNNEDVIEDVKVINFLFGTDEQDWGKNKDNIPGAFSVSDAKLLAFPMRSNIAPFVWVTCPAVLKRLKNDLDFMGIDNNIEDNLINVTDDHAYVILGNILNNNNNNNNNNQIILEDAVVQKKDKNITIDFLNNNFSELENLILISDQMFDYCVGCTDIQTNIKIDTNTGTAAAGALRYQEFLPADTVMYSVVYFGVNLINDLKVDMIKNYIQSTIKDFIQIGGDQTVGKGICKIDWIDSDKGGQQ